MEYQVEVEVSLKSGYSDPEGETTRKALIELKYPVSVVKVSKVYSLHLEASSSKDARQKVDEICRRLLANPVKDNYKFKLEELK